MGVELGRISGPLLANNLLRHGVDLAFETTLLYIDVNTGRIGINTDGDPYAISNELTVNGTTRTTNLIVDTRADEIAKFTISTNRIQNVRGGVDGIIYIQPDQLSNPQIITTKIGTRDYNSSINYLNISDKLIENLVNNSDINFTPNGTGKVNFTTNKVNVDGDLHATGNISWDGNVTFGSDDNDSVRFRSEIASSIIPDQNNFYDLGSLSKEWATVFSHNVYVDTATVDSAVVNDIALLTTPGQTKFVSINGNDSHTGTHQRDTFRTIKHALQTASAGDTVYIYPGNYEEEFPLTVPQGVQVVGDGIRSVNIYPTLATNNKDAFLLNGETTVENLTVKDYYYNSVDDTGYAFRFAPSITVSSRSPYIRNCTVITEESVVVTYNENRSVAAGDWSIGWFYAEPNQNHLVLSTNMVDPEFVSAITATTTGTVFSVTYIDNTVDTLTQTAEWDWFGLTANLPVTGFSISSIKNIKAISWGQISTAQGDAGRGALVDGSASNASSTEAAMLFHAVTMIIPNADGITATNGARVEWLNSFTYFAYRGIHLTEGTLGFANLGVKFGAEMRSINSANVYGTYGAVADGPSTLGYLIGHNFGYVGTGLDTSNDPRLVIQANEVYTINNGVIYFDSKDHHGDLRIGDIFYVNQDTGQVIFDAQSINFGASGSITLEGPSSTTYIDATQVQTGNIRIHGNTIQSVSGPVNLLAENGSTYLNTDVYVTGNLGITGDAIVRGTVYLGDNPLDTITIAPLLSQHLLPDDDGDVLNLGSNLKRWNTLFATLLDVDGIIQVNNNEISTLTSGTDLQLTAAGTGKIHVATNNVAIDQNLDVSGTIVTVNGLSTLQDVDIIGTLTQTGNINQTGNTFIIGTFANNNIIISGASYLEVPNIKLFNNVISATATNSDLNLVGNTTGSVIIDSKLKVNSSTFTNNWTGASTDLQKSIIFSPNGTGDLVINSTNALVLPVGNSTTRNLSAIGELRFNNNSNMIEGYSPSGRVNFMNVWDSDRNTYITPELTPGANDNTIRFGINGTVKATITSTALTTNTMHVDNVRISGNTIDNLVSSSDIDVITSGTGSILINSIPFKDNTITNTTTGAITIASTGAGYVKFTGTGAVRFPIGPSNDRRALPEVGEIRNNTTLGYMEVFCGDTNQGDNGWIPALGTSGAASEQQVYDIMDEWTLILG